MGSPLVRLLPLARAVRTRGGIPPLRDATLTSLPFTPQGAETPLLRPPLLLARLPLLLLTGNAPGDSPPSGPLPTHPSLGGLASFPHLVTPIRGPILALGPTLMLPLPLLRPHPPSVVDLLIPLSLNRRAHPSAHGTKCPSGPLGPLLAISAPPPSVPCSGVSPIGSVGCPPHTVLSTTIAPSTSSDEDDVNPWKELH